MILCSFVPRLSNFRILFYSSLSISTHQFEQMRHSLIHTHILTHVHTSLRYLSAVTSLDLSIRIGFNEDIVAVSGLSQVKIIWLPCLNFISTMCNFIPFCFDFCSCLATIFSSSFIVNMIILYFSFAFISTSDNK